MTSRQRNHRTAWLGLLAMCLLVLAPLVSQWVAARHAADPSGFICSAAQPEADGSGQHAPLSACGYCDLLAGHAAAPPLPAVLPVLALVLLFAAVMLPPLAPVPLGAFPSGRPRGPPASPRSVPFSLSC